MTSKLIRSLSVVTLVLSLGLSVSCSKKDEMQPESVSNVPTAPNADENTMGDSDSGKAMGLQTVNFPYDSFELGADAKAKLAANSQILKDKPSLKIQVEGHCDAKGGIQYNLALGEKRANATRKYLIDQGVGADRVTTISFGKEKLLDQAMTEEAGSKNRRANFVVTSR